MHSNLGAQIIIDTFVTSGESKLFNFQSIFLHMKIIMSINS
jgi:hypothetical protein